MTFEFKKGTGREDVLLITRPDGSSQTLVCPKQGIIPHEMVHYAVESVLNRNGFLAKVVQGEVPGYTMSPSDEAESVERLVEAMQADGWSGWTTDPAAILDMYAVSCDARASKPLPLQVGEIAEIRDFILTLTAQWSEVAPGQSLKLPGG